MTVTLAQPLAPNPRTTVRSFPATCGRRVLPGRGDLALGRVAGDILAAH